MAENSLQSVAGADSKDQAKQLTRTSDADLRVVLLHNDDVTPYDYVVYLLGSLFMLSEEIADHIAWTAHTKGKAVVVVRPREEAEKLVKAAQGRAKFDGFPLTFTLEQE